MGDIIADLGGNPIQTVDASSEGYEAGIFNTVHIYGPVNNAGAELTFSGIFASTTAIDEFGLPQGFLGDLSIIAINNSIVILDHEGYSYENSISLNYMVGDTSTIQVNPGSERFDSSITQNWSFREIALAPSSMS